MSSNDESIIYFSFSDDLMDHTIAVIIPELELKTYPSSSSGTQPMIKTLYKELAILHGLVK
jgi:hypothetical protein